jgi:hypothetical protein
MAGKLAAILEDLLAQAKHQAGIAAKRKLQNGLVISITVVQHETKITLGRQLVRPSLNEWNTVMKNFPYNTPNIIPTPADIKGWLCITGKVPSQHMMQQLKFS